MKPRTKNGIKSMLLLLCLIASLGVVCQGEESAARKFMVTAGGNFFLSSSGDFRQIYGQAFFMPEIKIMRLVYRNFFVWGSFSLIARDGVIEEVDEKVHIGQTLLGFGFGYVFKLSAILRLRGELGMTYISFKEEALDDTQKGSGLGWKIGANLDYFLGNKIFLTLTTAYSQAGDEAQTGKIELGGFQAGAGIGFAF